MASIPRTAAVPESHRWDIALIMGRKTYGSMGRPLPGRTTFVVTRDKTWRRDAVRAVPFLDEALTLAGDLAAEHDLRRRRR